MMLKYILSFAAVMASGSIVVAQKLEKLWATETLFKVPESVLFDASLNEMYVSNIDGASGAKDGKGSISKMKPDGKITHLNWVTGLHAPKGMAMYNDVLYFTDVDAVIGFSKADGKEVYKVAIEGAKFLNDLTVNSNGVLYVSDSETGKIHEIKNGKATVLVEKLARPNGVLWYKNNLYYLASGALFVRYADGSSKEIANGMERSTDGIESVDKDHFLISCWSGFIYLVNVNGTVTELLNTKDQKINSADIGYDPIKKIVYVPTFLDNRVVAYKLLLDAAKSP